MRSWASVVVVAACYAPSPQPGIACAPNGDCPAPLTCSPATGTCERAAMPGVDAARGDGAVPDGRAGDAAVDGPPVADCWAIWEAMGSQTPLSAPVALTGLDTPTDDRHPWLSPDGLTLYWATGGATTANEQIVFATRATRSPAAWGSAIVATDLDTDGVADSSASLTADGLVAIFSSTRTGGDGSVDLWQATRASSSTTFGSADHTALAAIDTPGVEADPDLSEDGLTLVYSSQSGSDLVETATRATRGDAFGSGAVLTITGAPADTNNPRMSPDGLVLFYTGTLRASIDIDIAVRATAGGTFVTQGGLSLDGPANDTGIGITSDGCDFVFASTRTTGRDFDLFEATVLAPN